MDFYQITFSEEDKYASYGVAYEIDCEELVFLPYEGYVSDWVTYNFELRDGDFCDYLATDRFRRVCSIKLRDILEKNKGPKDSLQWLPIIVRSNLYKREYYVLHFPHPSDVLDEKATMWVDGTDHVIKPALSKSKVVGHCVFSYPKDESIPLFVSDEVSYEIEESECTGLELTKCRIF
jgi:hypothetical protein